ncbi:MAG: hypothetical protein DMG11_35170 [Acidobacteria bacterium]|nr:MAG: hypothetical protein DMG11_35170 [Acidobacteriota bacterium]
MTDSEPYANKRVNLVTNRSHPSRERGVELTRRQEPVKANEIEAWAAQLERTSQVLSMDAACFREYARLTQRRSDTLGEDAMIAATARVHGLTVATRNERDFAHFDVAVLNPFK